MTNSVESLLPSGGNSQNSAVLDDLSRILEEFKWREGVDYQKKDLEAEHKLTDFYEPNATDNNSRVAEAAGPGDGGSGTYYHHVRYWYHPDYLGNVDMVTDRNGEAYQFFLYTPWGENMYSYRRTGTGFSSPYRFNGKELDPETGNYYYGARYYDPKTSIWLSVDPLSNKDHNIPLTPYHFVANNPVIQIDPNGLDWYGLADAEDGADLLWFDTEEQAKEHFGEEEFMNYGTDVTSHDPITGQQVDYFDNGKKYSNPYMLQEVEVDGGRMSDHARNMRNPIIQHMHQSSEKMMKEFSQTVLQNGGDAIALVGYGLTLTGVAAPVGIAVAGIGNAMSLAGTAVDVAYQIEAGDFKGARANGGFVLGGAVAGALAKKIPGSSLAQQILKQNAELKVGGLKRLVDSKKE